MQGIVALGISNHDQNIGILKIADGILSSSGSVTDFLGNFCLRESFLYLLNQISSIIDGHGSLGSYHDLIIVFLYVVYI